ncbi:LOW QUALITY PROTEIN: von Willebrand factor A domain-containing protein 1-like [Embiotoca jacksoni]|uniref:LOW QUALITY PROTEIN: von Willebrand factor A domain-containing protein 1-like n=1 Tax=Embiotoca jacksoni TaxID=100190 RepID=UPI003703B144
MKNFSLCLIFLWTTLQQSSVQTAVPATVLNCCEGEILLLLDSSGSVANYEFSRLLVFTSELLRLFSLGRGHVRVGLLQVGTEPHLEFGLDVHSSQESLQRALRSVRQLQGDTNTEAALRVAQQLLEEEEEVPKILLWLTDGVQPGDVEWRMSKLKERGVFVLAVSTVHGNYHVLRRVVTPPLESHLYSVDIDNMDIITEDLRDAIIRIIRAERLRVVHLTSHSAVLRWRPVLSADGFYEFWYRSIWRTDPEIRRALSAASSQVELTDLQPDTTYSASLRPESNQGLFPTLSVDFTTLSNVLSPAVVSLSDLGPRQIRVSWGPLQRSRVQRYKVEYGVLPGGLVRSVTLPRQMNSTLLTDLEPDTQYLVTVSALHVDGSEAAMSVRVCTQQAAPPALVDLQLSPVERQVDEVQAAWRSHQEGLKGFWVSWETGDSHSSPSQTSFYLPASAWSTRLTRLSPSGRVCVSPLYSSGRGDGICCTARTPAG